MSVTISKTKNQLIEVARLIFAQVGFDSTTMNDIARASGRGRRTLYTYFKNKREIYLAVVKTELDHLYNMLLEVAEKDLPADEKLMTFIYTRLDSVKDVVSRNGSLRANFFRDVRRVEKVRRDFDLRETEILENILCRGIEEGIFEMPDPKIMAQVLHYALKGLEIPYIQGVMGNTVSQRVRRRDNVIHLLFDGIKRKRK